VAEVAVVVAAAGVIDGCTFALAVVMLAVAAVAMLVVVVFAVSVVANEVMPVAPPGGQGRSASWF
jgi:hypothetical protein